MPLKSLKLLLLAITVVGLAAGQETAPPNSAELATRNEIQLIEKLLSQLPDRAPALFQLAHDYATLGDSTKAMSLLRQCIALGEGFNPEGDPAFAALKGNAEFKALLEQVHGDFPPVHRARVAFTIPEKDLIPEGLAFDPGEHVFYMGSLSKRKILRIRKGEATEFTSERDHLGPICGIKADARNGDVWANTCRNEGTGAELVHFDSHGKLLERFGLTTAGPHLFNDLVLRNENEIYLTDSLANQAFRFDREKHSFTALRLPRPVYYPNGITLSEDGNLLYIADAFGVLQYDLRSNRGREVAPGMGTTLSGFDGLYWYRGSLVGIQNGLGMPRVARFQLDDSGELVTGKTVLEYRSNLVELPTTGAIDGSKFYFMANTQIDNWNEGRIVDPNKLAPIRVAVIQLH